MILINHKPKLKRKNSENIFWKPATAFHSIGCCVTHLHVLKFERQWLEFKTSSLTNITY